MEQTKELLISWEQLHNDCRKLASQLIKLKKYEAIISITRGGLVPAAIIARELEIRTIETICVASYDHKNQGKLSILKSVQEQFLSLDDKLLIIDDLSDTGKTAVAVKNILPKSHFAAVYTKSKGKPLIDSFVREVSQDTWIFFPWDMNLQFTPPIISANNK